MATKTRTVREGVKAGILPNHLALEAVRRQLLTTCVVSGKEPLDGLFGYNDIVGEPHTKWSNEPILVVMDHGSCSFGAAYTTRPSELDNMSTGFSFMEADARAFSQDEDERRYRGLSDSELREEIRWMQKDILQSSRPAYRRFMAENVQSLRNRLRVRHHRAFIHRLSKYTPFKAKKGCTTRPRTISPGPLFILFSYLEINL